MSLTRPDPSLTDGVISLVPLSACHLEGMAALGHDEEVGRYTYVSVPFEDDDAVTWLARYIRGWRDGSCAGFAIEDATDGAFLGFCALVTIDHDGKQAEIGYITASAARGRGTATRAVTLISEWAESALGMVRLELRIGLDNVASLKVAERGGFEREGVLKSVHLKQGIRDDLVVFGRTRPWSSSGQLE